VYLVPRRRSGVRAQAVRTVHARRQGAVGNRPTRLHNLFNRARLLSRCCVDAIIGFSYNAIVVSVNTQQLLERAVFAWSKTTVRNVDAALKYLLHLIGLSA
jgi:hypothetical protein